jgi:hypothetical protein
VLTVRGEGKARRLLLPRAAKHCCVAGLAIRLSVHKLKVNAMHPIDAAKQAWLQQQARNDLPRDSSAEEAPSQRFTS